MLKLYGFAVSNYYNMVKLALLEKGAPEPDADWWPYMPIKRHIDTLFPAPGDVRDMAFWTARTLQRAHKD